MPKKPFSLRSGVTPHIKYAKKKEKIRSGILPPPKSRKSVFSVRHSELLLALLETGKKCLGHSFAHFLNSNIKLPPEQLQPIANNVDCLIVFE
jgi:hypothetical protein